MSWKKDLLAIPVKAAVFVERQLRTAKSLRTGETRCVLILEYDVFVGYCVHQTPLYEAIKRARPEVKIVVATWGMGAQLLRNSPYIDHLLETPKVSADFRATLSSLRRQLRERGLKPDCCLTGPSDSRTIVGLLAAASCNGWRGGYTLQPGLYHRSIDYDLNVSRLANNLRLANLIGIETSHIEPKVFYTGQDAAVAKGLLEPLRADGRPVLVAIAGSSGGNPTAWIEQRWAETICYAYKMLGYQIVFIGAPSDKVRIEQIQKLAGGIGVCLAGATSINQAAALIALSDLVVSINTGTAHVTRSVGTPAVILDIAWQKPLEWMVTDQAHIRLLRGPDQERAPDYCMEELTVEHVTAALTEMIELFPADEAAREARLAASLSDVELLRR